MPLKDVCSYGLTNYKRPKLGEIVSLIELDQIKSGNSKCPDGKEVIVNSLTIKSHYYFEKGMVLYSKLRPYLDKAIFKVQITKTKRHVLGASDIRFFVAINQGQDLSLLNETASGGEISRIMLAIKTIILKYNDIDTIIFDEIDTGVSGKVATRIGEKMKQIADYKQVICITHLPQVAALAHHHYCIEKKSHHDDTVTSIRLLNDQEKINEIAKMLSGEKTTQEAIENAKKLLNV